MPNVPGLFPNDRLSPAAFAKVRSLLLPSFPSDPSPRLRTTTKRPSREDSRDGLGYSSRARLSSGSVPAYTGRQRARRDRRPVPS
jgi:hypothetical protein